MSGLSPQMQELKEAVRETRETYGQFGSADAITRLLNAAEALLPGDPQTFVDEGSTPTAELRTGDIVRLTGASWDEWGIRYEEVEIAGEHWGPGFDNHAGSFAIWDPNPADKIIYEDYSVTRVAKAEEN